MSDADRRNAANRDAQMREVLREIRDRLTEIRDILRGGIETFSNDG